MRPARRALPGLPPEDGINHVPVIRSGRVRPIALWTVQSLTTSALCSSTRHHGRWLHPDRLAQCDPRYKGQLRFGWLAQIDGRANGATIDTLNDIPIDGLTVINATKGFDLKRCTGVTIRDCTPTEVTTSAGAPYVITADTVTDLCVDDNRFDGWLRGHLAQLVRQHLAGAGE